MAEHVILLHDDELDEEKRHEVRDVFSNVHEPTRGDRSGTMSPILRSSASLASRVALRLRSSKLNLSLDTLPAPSLLLRSFPALLFTFLLSLRPRYMRRDGLKPTKKPHITSYLDALRGWAAVIVLNTHYNPKSWMLNLPFVRLVVHGKGMVNVFFVISGYVLSYRMLKFMRSQQAVPLLDTIVSSVFRRYLRLYGSSAIASLFAMLLIQQKWVRRPDIPEMGFWSMLWDWVLDFGRFSNVFANVDGYWYRGVFSNKYHDVLWTIPVEFRGSMVLFSFCVGACKLSTRNRMLLCWFLMVVSCYWAAFYVSLFLGGLFLADLSLTFHPERLAASTALPVDNTKSTPRHQALWEKIFYSVVLICSFFLLSQPKTLVGAPWPWPFLDRFVPSSYRGALFEDHFWLTIGALLLVWALDSYPTLQIPLKWNFSQYLGDLSFGIYVMHYPVLWTIWLRVLNPLRVNWFGNAMWSYAPFLFVNFFVVLWAADLFIRVDTRIVAFGKWTQTKFFRW